MAGKITQATIDRVREEVRLDEVVSNYVTLRPAGMDSLKGLCPFHDEKTPSFHVRPNAGFWHCFGCGEGGDTVSFIQRIEHLDFPQTIEFLAGLARIPVEYTDRSERSRSSGQRQRLVDALRSAEQFYRQQLNSEEAQPARDFLTQRAFGPDDCAHFGIGYAPRGWENLSYHLRRQGFSDEELLAAGLASKSTRGGNVYDRFRGRLMWPIRDVTGTTVGFGARKIHPDDEGPKYLNSPETMLYKKSTVLYGIDLAKRAIAKQRQVVIVEGYTDVMAAHLAGIETAVATCGTAFGSGHTQVIRRLMGDVADAAAGVQLTGGRSFGGEVVFTFDGDEAGQKAALRAFEEDSSFSSQTFVAVAAQGMDPCDLRLAHGDEALRQLIDRRVPLFEFVLKSQLSRLDLATREGRVQGLRVSAPVVAQIRDRALRREYVRSLAGWLGMEERDVVGAVREAQRRPRPQKPASRTGATRTGQRFGEVGPNAAVMAGEGGPGSGAPAAGVSAPTQVGTETGAEVKAEVEPVRLPRLEGVQRTEALAIAGVLQYPQYAVGSGFDELKPEAFTHPVLAQIFQLVKAQGGITEFGRQLARVQQSEELHAAKRWRDQVCEAGGHYLSRALTQLCVTPLPISERDTIEFVVRGYINALRYNALSAQEQRLAAKLNWLTEGTAEYEQCFTELASCVEQRRAIGLQR
ncbi:MAG: DNA primase [Actinomycetaceae bacterium]|nr:DNA primase [Actinomycetaceae bacterium]